MWICAGGGVQGHTHIVLRYCVGSRLVGIFKKLWATDFQPVLRKLDRRLVS